MGRVQRIEATQIVLADGTIPTNADVLHIDCTAHGLARRPARPIFDGDRITLLPVTLCQPAFSSAFIALVEMRCADDARKNSHCRPVPHPEYPDDLFTCTLASLENVATWSGPFGWWLTWSRLAVSAHFSLPSFVRFMYTILRWLPPCTESLRRIVAASTGAEPSPDA